MMKKKCRITAMAVILLNIAIVVSAGEKDHFDLGAGMFLNGKSVAKIIVSGAENNKTIDLKERFAAGIEFYKNIEDGFFVGGGLDFETKLQSSDGIYYENFLMPVYGGVKFQPNILGNTIKPYLKGRLGWTIPLLTYEKFWGDNPESKGGLFYLAGAGVRINGFNIEAAYEVSNYSVKTLKDSYEFENKAIRVSAGYSFDLPEAASPKAIKKEKPEMEDTDDLGALIKEYEESHEEATLWEEEDK